MRKFMFGACAMLLFGCAQQQEQKAADLEEAGQLSIAITQVPPDAYCLRVAVDGYFSTQKDFDVVPGQSSTVSLDQVSVGFVTITANTYYSSCAGVTPAFIPTWFSQPTNAFIYANGVNNVSISMLRNGQLSVSVDFVGGDSFPTPACADGSAEQGFAGGMVGCAGVETWANRDTLCGIGLHACTAAQWVAYRNGQPAAHNYWTADNLGYDGAGPNACFASITAPYACADGQPMHICSGSMDPEGNSCNWFNCGLDAQTPNEFFGGCNGNETAGTVCCY